MERGPLHDDINTLTSKQRLQVVMESVNIQIGKHRSAVNAEDGGHRKHIYTLPAPLPDGTRQSIRVSGRILHTHTPCTTGEV